MLVKGQRFLSNSKHSVWWVKQVWIFPSRGHFKFLKFYKLKDLALKPMIIFLLRQPSFATFSSLGFQHVLWLQETKSVGRCTAREVHLWGRLAELMWKSQ